MLDLGGEVDAAAAARRAGDDASDLHSARSRDQRALDAAAGRAPFPPETAVFFGDGARLERVRRGL